MLKLPTAAFPTTLRYPPVYTLPPVIVPVALTMLPVNKFPPLMFATATIVPTALRLPL